MNAAYFTVSPAVTAGAAVADQHPQLVGNGDPFEPRPLTMSEMRAWYWQQVDARTGVAS